MSRVLRTLRQKRLREIGEAGQARLFAGTAVVRGQGTRAEMALRYLVGAGIGRVRASGAWAALVQRLDAEIVFEPEDGDVDAPPAPEWIEDAQVAEAWRGVAEALRQIRAIALEQE